MGLIDGRKKHFGECIHHWTYILGNYVKPNPLTLAVNKMVKEKRKSFLSLAINQPHEHKYIWAVAISENEDYIPSKHQSVSSTLQSHFLQGDAQLWISYCNSGLEQFHPWTASSHQPQNIIFFASAPLVPSHENAPPFLAHFFLFLSPFFWIFIWKKNPFFFLVTWLTSNFATSLIIADHIFRLLFFDHTLDRC